MTVWLLAVAVSALSVQSQSAFDRVVQAPVPSRGDTEACEQSQAAAISVALPEELPLLYFRKGFCSLAGAGVNTDSREFQSAAADFDKAIELWPGRFRKGKIPAEPVPNSLRVLPWIARLKAGVDPGPAWKDSDIPSCNSYLMDAALCSNILESGKQWLGRQALQQGRLDDAARLFAGAPATGWQDWAEGLRQFSFGKFPAAIRLEQSAIATWQKGPASLVARLGPAPDMSMALADLGGAQLVAGELPKAIETLNAALKINPGNPQAYYRRARARDLSGQAEAALTDYSMASRAAFAASHDLASGEAHLYRGVLMYRRKEFARAEDEFATALNFEIPASQRADAQAWRHLAAVAGGSCNSAKESLGRSLASVSPYFPTAEALRLASACNGTER